ncbi:hypothetical protein PAXRUDRAFT_832234 [Paxillus rubicundulus Ve08.2h10]|uniref:Uncharacterized protein n=1 Tax=Paxillus rubicundulus Ve08.2h10 TaxID=930991 RepID=A0A0D0DDI6_9AGAM|nr:hypothetical protein PAXRUDRAFT_832234 [Paxillus rubicundulus Ve08.2h10]
MDINQTPPDDQATLKRRIAALEEQNTNLLSKLEKKPRNENFVLEGRAIRRLVSLVDRVEDLLAEHDRRVMLGGGNDSDTPSIPSSDVEQYQYRSYQKLIRWCPSIRKLMQSDMDTYQLNITYRQLNQGADGARGDDASMLKVTVATWLMEQTPCPEPAIHSRDKASRGFNHDVTGRLLCPVDYDWEDPSVRAGIRDYHPDFLVTAFSWPRYLYENLVFDPKNPTKGLFRGELLLKAFRCIFTSPSSAESGEDQNARRNKVQRTSGERRTRCDVAGLLKMHEVQPRAIAYGAVQLRQSLSSSGSWRIVDEDFDNEAFYYNIVDYFELPTSQEQTKEVDDLLLWWNRQIFRRQNVSSYRPQQVKKLSVALCRPTTHAA